MSRRNSLASTVTGGIIAGAVGTFALDVSTYADIALRGRPPSEVPEKVAGRFLEQAGIDLGDDPDVAKNRRSAIGTLFGYGTGVAGGIAYALVRRRRTDTSTSLLGIGLGLGVMAVTDTSSTLAGATDPRTWGVSGWLADAFFHAIYGVATAGTFDSWSRSQRL